MRQQSLGDLKRLLDSMTAESGTVDSSRNIVAPYLFGENGLAARKRISLTLFYVGYGIWLIWKLICISMFSFPEGSIVNTAFHVVTLLILVLSSLISLRIDGSFVLACITGVLGVAVEINAETVVFIDLAVILYAGGISSFRKTAAFSLLILSIGSILIVTASQVGIVPDVLFPRGDAIDRHGLGFLYCTNLSHLYLGMVLLYLFLRNNQARPYEYLAILIIDFIIFYLTDSRNSCGLVLITVLLSTAIKCVENASLHNVLLIASRGAFVFFTIVGLVFALGYNKNSEAWVSLNKITSNRIAQDNASLTKYGVLPFGQSIEFANRTIAMGETAKTQQELNPSGDRNIVESSFLNILITKGWVSLCMVLAAFWFALEKNEDSLIAVIMLIIAVHSAFDFQLINLLYTTFLFYIWNQCAEKFNVLLLFHRAH